MPGVLGRDRTGVVTSTALILLVAVVVVVVVVAVFAALRPYSPSSYGFASRPSASVPSAASPDRLAAWQSVSDASAHAHASNDTLWVARGSPHLLVLLSPSSHDDSFVINGLSNPAVHVATGARMAITVVNMDQTDTHTWTLTDRSPPYYGMPMMGSGGMYVGMHVWGSAMMPAAQGSSYWAQDLTFVASGPGSFWYLCMHPGHASEGMYGSFSVN